MIPIDPSVYFMGVDPARIPPEVTDSRWCAQRADVITALRLQGFSDMEILCAELRACGVYLCPHGATFFGEEHAIQTADILAMPPGHDLLRGRRSQEVHVPASFGCDAFPRPFKGPPLHRCAWCGYER